MTRNLKAATFAGIVILLAVLAGASTLFGAPAENDIKLFAEKCGRCHSWERPIKRFQGESSSERADSILKMQAKKPGWISDADAAAITKLLTENEMPAVQDEINRLGLVESAAVLEKEHNNHLQAEESRKETSSAEKIIGVIKYVHGTWNAACFLLLGIYMAMSGLTRYSEEKKGGDGPRKFNWMKHVSRGKFYVVFVILGLCGGLAIFALDGFDAGDALPHLIAGCAVALLYAAGGLIGLKLAKGQAANLKVLHMILNLTATALFAFNIISGVILLLGD